MRVREDGVTLIELMTALVVLAILASIAVPSYRSYLLRSQRADAKTALLQLQAAQEKFYLQNNKYTDNIAGAPPAGLGLTAKSAHAFYDIAVDLGIPGNADSDQGYTATATPAPGSGQQDDTKCTSLTLTDRGERDATPSGSRDYCWR